MTHDPTQVFIETLRRILPNAIERAAQSYRRFSEQDEGEGAKSFSAHHSACKTALAHLLALSKLTQFLDKRDPLRSMGDDDLETLLRQARHTLADSEPLSNDTAKNQL
jgi:hypothetical protein